MRCAITTGAPVGARYSFSFGDGGVLSSCMEHTVDQTEAITLLSVGFDARVWTLLSMGLSRDIKACPLRSCSSKAAGDRFERVLTCVAIAALNCTVKETTAFTIEVANSVEPRVEPRHFYLFGGSD